MCRARALALLMVLAAPVSVLATPIVEVGDAGDLPGTSQAIALTGSDTIFG